MFSCLDDDNLALRLYDKLMQRLQKALSILEDETTTESKHEIKVCCVTNQWFYIFFFW